MKSGTRGLVFVEKTVTFIQNVMWCGLQYSVHASMFNKCRAEHYSQKFKNLSKNYGSFFIQK